MRTDQVDSADRPLAQQDVQKRRRFTDPHDRLLDGSPRMRAIRTVIENIADTDATVLISGESGVGKDLVARAIHDASSRGRGPFIKVNCAAIPSELLESELFGHEKGAFTGAHRRKPGQFEFAHKGTIYLDEIAELPLALQAKLLHVLQDFSFSRVGGYGLIAVDARVIAATNRDLEDAITRGEFREDLYYRLNVVEIRVPPLRERREEIPGLAAWFLDKFNAQYGRQKELRPETVTRLMDYSWPGNVRELENVIRRLVVLADSEQAIEALVASRLGPAPAQQPMVTESLREIARRGAREAERHALAEVLERVRWNRAEASRILQVSYKTLLNKITECGLTPASHRQFSSRGHGECPMGASPAPWLNPRMRISSTHTGPAQSLPPDQPIEVEAAMSQHDALRVIHEAFKAWNAHDVDRYAALLDEGYVEETHTVLGLVRGREAARAAMQEFLRVLPDLHFDLDVAVGSGDQVFTRWQVTGTCVGELTSVAPSDRRLEDFGCTLSKLKQGKIIHVWHYWETDHILRHVATR